MKNCLSLTAILLFICSFLYAQPGNNGRIDLHTNCDACDMQYIRQEIGYVQHVRDQALANVQLFINRIRNASGGSTFEISFTGFEEFDGITQESKFTTQPTQTRDEVRNGLLQHIEAGLVSYLLQKSTMAELVQLDIENVEMEEEAEEDTFTDPWDFWIFEVRGEGDFNKETSRNGVDLEFGAEANRVTQDWRMRFNAEANFSRSQFTSDDEEFVSERQVHFVDGLVVKSLGPNWSVGMSGGASHNTFNNINFSYNLRPAIEYSLYPYDEVIRREITFAYRIGFIYNNYLEPTIYNQTEENLGRQSLQLRARFRQPWGDIFSSLEASSFLHDFSRNRLEFRSWLNIRVYKGLAVRFSSNIQLIRDQITLPGGDASLEDLLLQQRQIATNFEMRMGVGLSYTFGSAFNSIVNTRL